MKRKTFSILFILFGMLIFIIVSVLGTYPIGNVKLSDTPAVLIGLIGAMTFLFGMFNLSNWNIWLKIVLSIFIPLILLYIFMLIIYSGGGII